MTVSAKPMPGTDPDAPYRRRRFRFTSDLGITGLWLMPIQASPSYHGYDITDYYTVNPDYGTMDDFRRFLDAAHARGEVRSLR